MKDGYETENESEYSRAEEVEEWVNFFEALSEIQKSQAMVSHLLGLYLLSST